MSNNLVLAAAIGYKFEQIEFFVKSLRKFYNNKIVFLISEKDKELKSKLIEFNCETVITKINKKEIQFKRYSIFFEYLKNKKFENSEKYAKSALSLPIYPGLKKNNLTYICNYLKQALKKFG